MPLNIRWRTTLWNVAAFAVVLASFGALLYWLLRNTHYEQVDRAPRSLLERLKRNLDLGAEPETALRQWVAALSKETGARGLVVDGSGRAVAVDERLTSAEADELVRVAARGEGRASVVLPGLGHQRVIVAPIAASSQTWVVVTSISLQHVDEEMGDVLAALATTIPVTILVAAGLAYFLACRALRPVERLRQMTDEITAQRLDLRLPAGNPHDEIGLLAQTINAMIERLERSFTEIRRFTGDASHELRTPMSIIRAEVEEALDRESPTAETRALLGSILEECERLECLTQQLLMLSREEGGAAPPKPEAVDLSALAQEVADSLHALATARGQTLSVIGADAECVAHCDSDRLGQALINLVENAIKFTPEGGRIEIELSGDLANAVIIVRDTGIGIPAEHLSRIFDRFYRVEKSRSRSRGGAGLGLSIVQSIVAAQGGRVDVTSVPEQGSEFRVTLPRPPSDAIRESGPHRSDEDAP